MLGARGAGGADQDNMAGMDHDNLDVLAAEPRRKGGLVRSDNVSVGEPGMRRGKLNMR